MMESRIQKSTVFIPEFSMFFPGTLIFFTKASISRTFSIPKRVTQASHTLLRDCGRPNNFVIALTSLCKEMSVAGIEPGTAGIQALWLNQLAWADCSAKRFWRRRAAPRRCAAFFRVFFVFFRKKISNLCRLLPFFLHSFFPLGAISFGTSDFFPTPRAAKKRRKGHKFGYFFGFFS